MFNCQGLLVHDVVRKKKITCNPIEDQPRGDIVKYKYKFACFWHMIQSVSAVLFPYN